MPQIKFFREHAVVWMESRDHQALYWAVVMITGEWSPYVQSFKLGYNDGKSDLQFTLSDSGVSEWRSKIKPMLERRFSTEATLMR